LDGRVINGTAIYRAFVRPHNRTKWAGMPYTPRIEKNAQILARSNSDRPIWAD